MQPAGVKTPTAVRYRDGFAPVTPKQQVRVSAKLLTPRSSRTGPTSHAKLTSIYAAARQLFAESETQTRLTGRQIERAELRNFISETIQTGSGGSLYVSGPPGTGKSALVDEVIRESVKAYDVAVCKVNCVGIKSSKDVFQKIITDLSPETCVKTQSEQRYLSRLFLGQNKYETAPLLVVLDEVDSLLSLDIEALYTLFHWALHKSSRLILIGIANALDLTDRFLPRLKARNLNPRLLSFMPYTASEIVAIITGKLRSTLATNSASSANYVPFVHPAAIQLCSKKIASQSGDLRKVFNLIRRAIDCIEHETCQRYTVSASSPTKVPFADITNRSIGNSFPLSPPLSSPIEPPSSASSPSSQSDIASLTAENAPRATVAHVARLTASIFNNDAVSRLTGLNLQQKAVLCSLVAAEKWRRNQDPLSSPSKAASRKPLLADLYSSYTSLCKQENLLCPLSATEFRDVVSSLETLGLVYEANGRTSFLTPTKTPSRLSSKNDQEKRFTSAVTEKELEEHLRGPGSDILRALLQ